MLFGAFRPQTMREIKAPGEGEESAARRTFVEFFRRVVMEQWPTQGDEKCLGPATTVHRTVAISFVIPSADEGSAVLRTLRGNVCRQSGAICGFAQSVTNAAVHK